MPIGIKTVWAIIPARAGSKRFPGKNLALFRGKSLIQHAIDHAQASKYIDAIILNSDSAEILTSVNPQPGLIFHHRPHYLGSDSTTSEAVLAETLYRRLQLPDLFVLLQPTSPLRAAADIDACLETASKNVACISVRQDGSPNGAVYAMHSLTFLEHLSLHPASTFSMPDERSIDIDTQDQLEALTSPQDAR